MISKGVIYILFLSFILTTLAGCTQQSGRESATRVLIGGNIQGQIYSSQEKKGFVQGTLARVGGMIGHLEKDNPKPTVMIQAGNTISLQNINQVESVKRLSECMKLMGFDANLASNYEFNDSDDYAKVRAETGWKQVVSNIKPLEGIDPPIVFEQFHMANPGNGRFVYFLNMISKRIVDDSSMLKGNYEWVDPSEILKSFIRTIRTKDILIVYYQTDIPGDLNAFFDTIESEKIALLLLNDNLYQKLQNEKRRPKKLKGVNLERVPKNVSTLQSVEIWWDPISEKWITEGQTIMAGLNYPKNKEIENLLDKKRSN